MPSVIPGYEYDVFISYRQKDNKLDGWVTEFVNTLKNEIEATFKKDISIYFDENTHDGLLETHDVDKSLKEKIKCIVFLSIVSQTYCDPDSFAWQKEFLAFRDFAKGDKFGLEIKVANGNVARRILPIQIHEIDQTDRDLFEKESGGVMRGVDFIYKESGVNRPLKPSDKKEDNLLGTSYRNQVNKVANAIKEIINSAKGTKKSPSLLHADPALDDELGEGSSTRRNKLIGGVLVAIFLASLFWVFNRHVEIEEHRDQSLAVLPFKNLSNDPEQEYFSDGLTEDILDQLAKLGDVRLISNTSSMTYKNSTLTIPQIGEELNVSYILEGSVRKDGNSLRIVAQLIDAKTDRHIWSETMDKELDDIFAVQSELAMQIASYLRISITGELMRDLSKAPTKSIAAYDLYLKAGEYGVDRGQARWLRSVNQLHQAIKIDPEFADAYGRLSYLYSQRGRLDSARYFAEKTIQLDPQLSGGYVSLGFVFWNQNELDKAIKNFKKANELRRGSGTIQLGSVYMQLGKMDSAMMLFRQNIENNPRSMMAPTRIGEIYLALGMTDSAQVYFQKAMLIEPEFDILVLRYADYFTVTQDFEGGIEYVEKTLLTSDDPFKQNYGQYKIGIYYAYLQNWKESKKYLSKVSQQIMSDFHALVYQKLGMLDSANLVFDKNLEKSPEGDHFSRARIHAAMGNTEKAIEELQTAVDQFPYQGDLVNLQTLSFNPFFEDLWATPELEAVIEKLKSIQGEKAALIERLH